MGGKTRAPRIAITVTPQVRELVEEVAEMTGRSYSQIVSELLDTALPAIKATRDALRVIKEQPREAERLMARAANQAVAEAAQAQLDLAEFLDARTMEGKRSKRGRSG